MAHEYKNYKIESDGTFGYVHIKPVGRGSVDKSLRGAYTSSSVAYKAIDAFLANKEKGNGKTKSSK